MTLEQRKQLAERRAGQARDELRKAVRELSAAARHRLDVGEHLRSHPWPWLAGATAVGLWLGTRR